MLTSSFAPKGQQVITSWHLCHNSNRIEIAQRQVQQSATSSAMRMSMRLAPANASSPPHAATLPRDETRGGQTAMARVAD
jgi:hypothetical protein